MKCVIKHLKIQTPKGFYFSIKKSAMIRNQEMYPLTGKRPASNKPEPIPILELLLGKVEFNKQLILATTAYSVSFFGIILIYCVFENGNKEFFDMKVYFEPIILNSILLLISVYFFYTIINEKKYISLVFKYMIYFFMPVHLVFQLEVIKRNTYNFVPIYESILMSLETFSQYFVKYLPIAGIVSGALLVIAIFFAIYTCDQNIDKSDNLSINSERQKKSESQLKIQPSYIFAFNFILFCCFFSAFCFFILCLPFIFYTCQYFSIFVFIPKHLIYNSHYIISNYKYSY